MPQRRPFERSRRAQVVGASIPGPSGPAGPAGPAGGGTVTHTAGALTANALVIGNAADDVKVLGSLGTTTQLLHGNAAGAPSFSPVDLTADVTGSLPVAKGGTGAATLAAHGLVIGNGTGAVAVSGAGTTGQVVTSNGASADPTFQTLRVVSTSTVTGAQNDWAPTIAPITLHEWSGAADAAFTGLAGGAAGHRFTFKNTGTKVATFAHASGSSAAANRFTNMATSAATPVAAGGYVTYMHDGTNWVMVAHDQGAAITPTFAAGDFTSSAGTWTVEAGDVTVMKYTLKGRRLSVDWGIDTSTTSGAGALLQIGNAQWGGFTSAYTAYGLPGLSSEDGSNFLAPWCRVASTVIHVGKISLANWANGTNVVVVRGGLAVDVT